MADTPKRRPRRQFDDDFKAQAVRLVLVVNEGGLRRVLASYIAYYMRSRTHLSLAQDSPESRPVQSAATGRIVATPEPGGLHHRYDRVAA